MKKIMMAHILKNSNFFLSIFYLIIFSSCNDADKKFESSRLDLSNEEKVMVLNLMKSESVFDSQLYTPIDYGSVDKQFIYSFPEVKEANLLTRHFIDSVKEVASNLYKRHSLKSINDLNLQTYFNEFIDDDRDDLEYFHYDFNSPKGYGVFCYIFSTRDLYSKSFFIDQEQYCSSISLAHSNMSKKIFLKLKKYMGHSTLINLKKGYQYYWHRYIYDKKTYCKIVYRLPSEQGFRQDANFELPPLIGV